MFTGRIVRVIHDILLMTVVSNKVLGKISKTYNDCILGKDKNNIISYINFIYGLSDTIKSLKSIAKIPLFPVYLIIESIRSILA